MKKTTDGICKICNGVFNKTEMKKHLKTCRLTSGKGKGTGQEKQEKKEAYYCIAVQGNYEPDYWIYLDMPAASSLKVLDSFLRKIWLECCGHMSEFVVKGMDNVSMSKKLENVFGVGDRFMYVYDFGSTTELKLEVVSAYDDVKRKTKVRLLARNIAPDFKCVKCGEPATQICVECRFDGDCFYCDNCAEDHLEHEEMLLPAVNSPRMGECGYCGEQDIY